MRKPERLATGGQLGFELTIVGPCLRPMDAPSPRPRLDALPLVTVKTEPRPARGQSAKPWPKPEPPRNTGREYVLVIGVLASITGLCWRLPGDYYLAIGFLYLLAVILLSLRVGPWPVLLAVGLSVAIWDYVYVPPWGFVVAKVQDAILLGPYFVVAMVAGQLTAWIRAQVRREQVRERRATALFELTRSLAEANTLDEAVPAALQQIGNLFHAQATLALADLDNDALVPHSVSSPPLTGREQEAAQWSLHYGRHAGRFTENLPDCQGYYVPLLRHNRAVGVLGVRVPTTATLTLAQRDLLEAFASQLAMVVEREHLRAASEREKLLATAAKLHRTLLESVSHELRTPLAVINSALENLSGAGPGLRDNLIAESRTAVARLNRLVGNLLDQTRLESGTLKPRLDWCDAEDLINDAVESTGDALLSHPLEIHVPDNLPLLRADFALTEQALVNLLLNVVRHTPATTPVSISAGREQGGQRIFFAVADRGPGFDPGLRERLFHKFARGDSARVGGLGLGLSIVRGFITAQGGEVTAGENNGGGAIITLYLPHMEPENSSPE